MDTVAQSFGELPAVTSPSAVLACLGLLSEPTVRETFRWSERTLQRRIAEGLPVIMIGDRKFFSPGSLREYLLTLERGRNIPVRRGRPTTNHRRAA